MSICCLRSDQIDAHWSDFAHHLERLESETALVSTQDLREHLKEARKQLWCVFDGQKIAGVVITEVYATMRGSICCMWGACGTQNAPGQIAEMLEQIEGWARQLNCVALEIKGRPGWHKLFPEFKRTYVVLEKLL